MDSGRSPNEEEQARLDRVFMKKALAEAGQGKERGEVPVGAVVVTPDGEIVGSAHNSPLTLHDPSGHAEILALRRAGEFLRNYRLNGCTIYVTIEPCLMCAGAILHARMKRLVYGAADPKTGAVHSLYETLDDRRLNHQVDVTGGVLAEECASLLSSFFAEKRKS
jgi:tRNA(adenine34) deaminase